MKNKGFMITVDAVAALAFVLVVVMVVSQITFTSKVPTDTYLKQVSQDLLVVLEKDGSLELMMAGNSTPARKSLLAAPESICMTLSVNTPEGQRITMISKPDCAKFKYEFQTANIAVQSEGNIYLASVESWNKRVE